MGQTFYLNALNLQKIIKAKDLIKRVLDALTFINTALKKKKY